MDDDDDWGLTPEELDSLERDAILKVAQQHQQHGSVSNSTTCSSSAPFTITTSSHSSNKVQGLPPASSRILPTSIASKSIYGEELPMFSVKFVLHASGNIAAKFMYNSVLVEAFRKIPKACWNTKERLWMFPLSSLSTAEKVLSDIAGFTVEVKHLDPLVQRAIAAASATVDLRDRYARIPCDIESKLLPFQRDGVRFVLQHGGRALLADEMGLGKTLQAIAVTSCIRESWPVLVLTPSSLRLHWASMIQQWLDIPSSEILVVLSQSGGSNRGGFTVVSTNTKGTIHLDGLFNIISYDVVPKLQNVLMASDFKVVLADESHFLKNAQAKRTSASLPVIKVPEYSYSLDEEGICKTAFELIFAFDEVISLGHKENVTVAQVKQYCEMESHEEKLHKLVLQSKINETKDVMKRKASEIDKSRIEKNRGDKGGFMSSMGSMGSGRIESSFNDMSISSGGSGFGSGSGFGLSTDVESFSSKPKGRPSASATAPPKGLGMQLGKSQKTNQFLESLKAEGEVILEDVQPKLSQSRSAAPPLTDPITLTVEEKLNVTLKRDGGLSNFDVQGTLSLQILNQEDALIQVQVESGGNLGILFKTHPNMNRELYANESILGLKDPNRPFPTGQAGDAAGVGLLRWRMQSADESMVPLTINCWPSVSGNETYVSIEYEASSMFDLRNVVLSVPLPALREAPQVRQIDGEWRFDSRNSILEWSILLIDNSNRSGSMEFVVPPADSSVFFPISVQFSATSTFSDLKVVNILPLKGGPSPKFAQRTHLITENYQVV